jgi:hypothetical protein
MNKARAHTKSNTGFRKTNHDRDRKVTAGKTSPRKKMLAAKIFTRHRENFKNRRKNTNTTDQLTTVQQ